jgi:uncharacterized membrane protein YeaQ/YmgE (transglycosylase-associated protein family)
MSFEGIAVEGIVVTLVIGFVAGLVARALVPGRQNFGLIATIALGLAGSVVGNLVVGWIRREEFVFGLGNWWASILGALLVLLVVAPFTGRRRFPR